MNKWLFLFLMLCVSSSAEAQFFQPHRSWAVRAGYTNYTYSAIELEAVRSSLEGKSTDGQSAFGLFLHYYAHAGTELYFQPNNFQVVPKIGIGGNLVCISANLSLSMFNDRFQSFYPALTPEVGVSLMGVVYCMYGYQVQIFPDKGFNLHPHRLTLRLHLFVN